MSGAPIEKTIYFVEKFLPRECPNCGHKFDVECVDWRIPLTELMGLMERGFSVRSEIIACTKCKHFTGKSEVESYYLSDPEAAIKLMIERDFVNFKVMTRVGRRDEDFKDWHVIKSGRVELI